MSGTTSASGFITETSAPASQASFENLINSLISALTGIPRNLVRPRWQSTPPTQPSQQTNWVAFGITRRTPDANPAIIPDPNNPDTQVYMQRHVIYETLCSFYGPDSDDLSETLRDSLRIQQNLDPLVAFNAGLYDVGETINVPELVNTQWYQRADLTINFIRCIVRYFPGQSIQSVPGSIQTDTPNSTWSF